MERLMIPTDLVGVCKPYQNMAVTHHQEDRVPTVRRFIGDVSLGSGRRLSLQSGGEDFHARFPITASGVPHSLGRDSCLLFPHDRCVSLSASKADVDSLSQHSFGVDDCWLGRRLAMGIKGVEGDAMNGTLITLDNFCPMTFVSG
jgi:hypothetical protein